MSIQALPAEVLRIIFQFLNPLDKLTACLVCQQWYWILQDLGIYKCINVVLQGNIDFAFNLLQCSPHRFVNLVIRENLTSFHPIFWENIGSSLRSLSFQNCKITEDIFIQLLKHCPNLKTLSLKESKILFSSSSTNATNSIHTINSGILRLYIPSEQNALSNIPCSYTTLTNLQMMRHAMRNVQELDLSDFLDFTNEELSLFLDTFINLEKLSLAGCLLSFGTEELEQGSNSLTFSSLIEHLTTRKTSLKSFDFSRTSIGNAALKELVEACKGNLQELFLSSCKNISYRGVLDMCIVNPKLQVLHLDDNKAADDILVPICQNLTDLKELNLKSSISLTDEACENMHFPKLEKLDLTECQKVTSEGIVKILKNKPNLKELKLALCDVMDKTISALTGMLTKLTHLDLSECQHVTDQGLQLILQHFLLLYSLKLAGCSEISDSGILCLPSDWGENPCSVRKRYTSGKCALSRLRGLRELDLSECEKLTDLGLEQCISFTELRYLNLSNCINLMDSGLIAIGRNNPSLEKLNVNHCSQITDTGIRGAVRYLPRLKCLSIEGCYRLTDEALNALLWYCPSLRNLYIACCNISRPSIRMTESKNAGLRIYR